MPELRDEILAEVRRILAKEFEWVGEVGLDDELAADLEVDSIGAIVLAVGLEDRFRVKLGEEDASGVVTVGDLVDLVARLVAEETLPTESRADAAGRVS